MTEKTSINNEEAIVKLLDGGRESLKKELDRMSFVAIRSLQDILSDERREYIISQTAEQKKAQLANPHEHQFSCITNRVMNFTDIFPKLLAFMRDFYMDCPWVEESFIVTVINGPWFVAITTNGESDVINGPYLTTKEALQFHTVCNCIKLHEFNGTELNQFGQSYHSKGREKGMAFLKMAINEYIDSKPTFSTFRKS